MAVFPSLRTNTPVLVFKTFGELRLTFANANAAPNWGGVFFVWQLSGTKCDFAAAAPMTASMLRAAYSFLLKFGIFNPTSDEAIKMPSRFVRVSSFLALITHQIESLL